MEEKITKKIAAAELLKVRRGEQTIYMAICIIIILIYGGNLVFEGITPILVVFGIGGVGYAYMKATKEVERLVKTYGL